MSNFQWWRSWHGAPMDHKWPVVAAKVGVKVGIISAIAWALMDYASQQSIRGSIIGFDTEAYAVYSGFSEDEVNAVILAMTEKGIITNGCLTNWEKRQPKREDDSTPRVRELRDRKRNVTQSNTVDEVVSISSLSTSASNSLSSPDSLLNSSEEDESACTWLPYSKAFTAATSIPELTGGPERFYKAIETMVKAGVEPQDITQAVKDMRSKNLVIASISSIVNPSIISMSKRKGKVDGKDRGVFAEEY